MKHGIIFDCDGTLVHSLGQALESISYALNAVGEAPPSPEVIKARFGAGADRILVSLLGDEARGLLAFEHYIEHQSQLAKRTTLHSGVRELLDLLAAQQVPMAVVTGRHERDLEVLLKPHNLADYFLALIADNQAPRSKPEPDGILMAAEFMGLSPENTLYVGDAIYDLQAAHRSGSLPVAALWDPMAIRAELEAERPAFVAETPADVWHFYQKVFH